MGLFDAPKTTNTTSPYPNATGALNTGLKDALDLYKTNRLNPYTPLSPRTQTALQGLNAQANRIRTPLQQSLQRYTNFANGKGDVSSAAQMRFANGAGDISSSGQLDIANRALGPSMTEQNLSGIAHGDLIGQNDENYNRLRQRAQENAATEAGMVASGMGRTGSDYHQTAVARQVGDTTAGMDYQRLQDERAHQVEANSLIDQMRQAGYGIGLNAQNSATAIQSANKDRRFDAMNAASGIQSGNQDRRYNANAAIPGAVGATMDPYQTMLDVGRAQDVNNASKNGTKGSNLSSLMQLLGIAAPYGTTTATEPSNKAGGMAGMGLGLASLLFG